MATSSKTRNTYLAEPTKSISPQALFEPSAALASRIKQHGFENLYSKGFLTVSHDTKGNVVRIDEPTPNILTSGVMEPAAQLRKKIKNNGGSADKLIKAGWLVVMPMCW